MVINQVKVYCNYFFFLQLISSIFLKQIMKQLWSFQMALMEQT